MTPTVSVIIPNYNHSQYLRQRIDSVINQTYQDFELIILDDSSTDNSREIIESYRNNSHISHIIYNEENSGSTFKQWEKGIKLSDGKWIWIAESDDWAESDFLENLITKIILHNNTALAFTNSIIEREDGISELSLPIGDQPITINGLSFIKSHMLCGNDIYNASSVIFNKDFIPYSSDYTKFKIAGDKLFWISICEHGDVIFFPKPLNHFRRHDLEVSSSAYKNGTVFEEELIIYKILKNKKYINIQNRYNIIDYYTHCIDSMYSDNPVIHRHLNQIWEKERISRFSIKLFRIIKALIKGGF